MFRGFEFEADEVGLGVSVFCLVEPEAGLHLLDTALTDWGVGYPRMDDSGRLRKSDKNLEEILQIAPEQYGGIAILPHARFDLSRFTDMTSCDSKLIGTDGYKVFESGARNFDPVLSPSY